MTRHDAVSRATGRGRSAVAALAFAAAALFTLAAREASADSSFRCELESAAGIAEADAATATEVICAALRRESAGQGSFRLALGRLGSLVSVRASREDTGEALAVQVQGLEELPVAAQRIAEALVRRRPFETTQRVDNLLEPETRLARSKQGSLKFSLGVFDLESPGHGARGTGFSIGFLYATPSLALPAEMSFGWDSSPYEQKGIGLFTISVGARRYLSRRDSSPFLGGGLALLYLSARDGGSYDYGAGTFDGRRTGIAAYGEGGVEILRLHRGRIGLRLRADLPFGPLRSEHLEYRGSGSHDYDPADYEWVHERRYVVPVTLGVNVAF